MISELLPLGFGKCALQVQVPVSGPLQSAEALCGGRIATSFEVLAGEFFAGVDEKDAGGRRTKVEYVGGSVEAACALGMADGIGKTRRVRQFSQILVNAEASSHSQLTSLVSSLQLPSKIKLNKIYRVGRYHASGWSPPHPYSPHIRSRPNHIHHSPPIPYSRPRTPHTPRQIALRGSSGSQTICLCILQYSTSQTTGSTTDHTRTKSSDGQSVGRGGVGGGQCDGGKEGGGKGYG